MLADRIDSGRSEWWMISVTSLGFVAIMVGSQMQMLSYPLGQTGANHYLVSLFERPEDSREHRGGGKRTWIRILYTAGAVLVLSPMIAAGIRRLSFLPRSPEQFRALGSAWGAPPRILRVDSSVVCRDRSCGIFRAAPRNLWVRVSWVRTLYWSGVAGGPHPRAMQGDQLMLHSSPRTSDRHFRGWAGSVHPFSGSRL